MMKFLHDGKGPVEVPEATIAAAYLNLPISRFNQKGRDAVLFLVGYLECLKVMQRLSSPTAFKGHADRLESFHGRCNFNFEMILKDLSKVMENKANQK